jgi:hypothetical protein
VAEPAIAFGAIVGHTRYGHMRLSADMETTVATHDPWDSGPEQVTYAEMLGQTELDNDERRMIRGEATLAHAATLLLQRGEQDLVGRLLDVIRLDVELSDDRYGADELWLTKVKGGG